MTEPGLWAFRDEVPGHEVSEFGRNDGLINF